jgi:hypothetical protein
MVAQSERNRFIDTSTATLPLYMSGATHTAQLSNGVKGRASQHIPAAICGNFAPMKQNAVATLILG